MSDPKTVLTFMLAGNAICTLRSAKSGTRYTYKIREGKKKVPTDPSIFFVNLLTGPDNTSDYTYLGVIGNGGFRLTGKSKMKPDSGPVVAFRWAYDCFAKGTLPASLEVWHSGRCGRCGRLLTDAESIATGFGPECSEVVGVARVQLPVGVETAVEPPSAPAYVPPPQTELVNDFKRRLANVSHPKQQNAPVAVTVLVGEADIDAASKNYRESSPEKYYDLSGMPLTEAEAHEIAYMKFKRELSK